MINYQVVMQPTNNVEQTPGSKVSSHEATRLNAEEKRKERRKKTPASVLSQSLQTDQISHNTLLNQTIKQKKGGH